MTELGHENTEHVHMHGMIWTNEDYTVIRDIWQYGWIYPRSKDEADKNRIGEATINYVMKYITKIDKEHEEYKSIILCSKGIGKGYLKRDEWKDNKYKGNETRGYYRTNSGHKIALPIYYRNNIYTEEEREKLWIQILDEEKRYILGKEIDISKGEEEYFKILKIAQKKNTEWGYGNNVKNWERIKYEEERRIMIQETRIAKENKQRKG